MNRRAESSRARLRILFVIGSGALGGAELQLARLAVGMRAKGHHPVVVFLTRSGPLTELLDAGDVPWRVMGFTGISRSRQTPKSVAGLGRLALEIRRGRYDVVHPWLALSIALTLPTAWVLSRRSIRVAALRGSELDRDWWTPLLRHAIGHAHAISLNSRSLLSDVLFFGGDPAKVRYVPNGVSLPPVVGDPSREPAAGVAIANMRPVKGLDVLIDALALTTTQMTVTVLGEGLSRDDLQQRAAVAQLTDRFLMPGTAADVPTALIQAEFLVHPSRAEGTPNAVLEAMAAGLPVIATDVGGTSELICDGVTGLLVPAEDAQALAYALDQLATNPQLRQSMGEQGRAKAQGWSWPLAVRAHEEVYAWAEASR